MEKQFNDWVQDQNGCFHKRDEWKYITSTPDGKDITSMITLNGKVIVSSTDHLYQLVDEKLEPIELQ